MAIKGANIFHQNKDFKTKQMNTNIQKVTKIPSSSMQNLDSVPKIKSQFDLSLILMYDDISYDNDKAPKKVESNSEYWLLVNHDKEEYV